jgi:chromosome segregation ATPase
MDAAIKQLEKKMDVKIDKAVTDISEVIQEFATHVSRRFDGVDQRFDAVDRRFDKIESELSRLQRDMCAVLNRLDSIEKDIAINEDERAVMGMQLTRLHSWVEKAALRVGVEFNP